ncbi:MAG: MBL fold metallo-hydrolase [Acetobacteraceae bacterium]|nr:MBL fold metallo-hydrolase [Acetobacteraceae bacterium]
MTQQVPIDEASLSTAEAEGGTLEAAPGVAYRRFVFVNVVFVGKPGGRDWVLVDAGLPGCAESIVRSAAERFGDAVPRAIVMTHGHFDHVGVLESLAERWDVPVYAHPLERPYLDGSASYPKADPTVGGGAMALLSPLYPRSPVDVGARLRDLPADGSIPEMPGWRWMHTPGHSVGHVSLWREADRTLIAGDAFITVAGESAYASAVQAPEIHGPPKYFTHDWQAAERSVRELAALEPEVVVTGHGRALHGPAMRDALRTLARDFQTLAVPQAGRYVDDPQRAQDGSAYKPA